MWGCDAQATKVGASPKMTKNDGFWGILQEFHKKPVRSQWEMLKFSIPKHQYHCGASR